MKKYLTVFTISLCLFSTCIKTQAAINTYPSYYNYNNTYRPIYNPYNTYNYNNSYLWQRKNQANYNRIWQRTNALNRLRYNLRNKLYNSYLSQLSKNQNTYMNNYPYNSYPATNANTNNNGTMTGYSVPVNEDVFKKLGLDNPKKIAPNTSNTDLFSSPSKGAYTNNLGEYWYNSRNTGTKTGVKIIYD